MKMLRLTGLLFALCAMNAHARDLRVCADPNNLPFSNQAGEGFENQVISLLARELGATVHYTWWAQRRGALRNTLLAGSCDVVPGVASGMEQIATTRPYYRSTYVFVVRSGGPLADLVSLDDPRLSRARIGVQMIGDDGANTPPAHALARRGIRDNVRGFMVYGDYASGTPQEALFDALARGEIDVAIAWGPTAGYFARKTGPGVSLTPVTPWLDGPQLPMQFDVSMGVRKEDRALRRELDRALERHASEVAGILADYGVPVVPATQLDAASGD
jgi:mxaJ protein